MRRQNSASIVIALGFLAVLPALSGTAESSSVRLLSFGTGTYLGDGKSINCWQGERLLRRRGFSDIRRMDCRGRYYVYHGSREGKRYEVAVRARDGRVVDRRRILR